MPSKEISDSEYDLIERWLRVKRDLGEASYIDHEISAERGALVWIRPSLWMVDNEPLVVAPRTFWFKDKLDRERHGLTRTLYCSNAQARTLEQASIASFSKEPQADAESGSEPKRWDQIHQLS